MAYYPDLTPYEFSAGESDLLNIGWLSKEQPFRRGPVPYLFASELRRLSQSPVNLYRGVHLCEFCTPPEDLVALGEQCRNVWEMARSGNGEVRVQSSSGATYAAPTLVWHYVVEHQYQPPQEFIDAVLSHKDGKKH
jgi:hypothetical protein